MALTATLNNKTISKISVNFKFFKIYIYIYIPSMHGRCKHSGEFLSNFFLWGRKGGGGSLSFSFFFLYANFNFTE